MTPSGAGASAAVASNRTYEMRVAPGLYALCVASQGSDTVSALAGPFAVTVSDRDLILDINVSQTTTSAPGIVGGRGAIRLADRSNGSATEASRAVSGLTLSGRVLVSGSVQPVGPRGGPPAGNPLGMVHLIAREAPGSEVRRVATARVDMQSSTEGVFEFWDLPPGHYDVLVPFGGPNQMYAFGRTSIDLRKDTHELAVSDSPQVESRG